MKLESMSYSQFLDRPRQWKIENVEFEPINLLVGRNAVGKTKTLTVINALARLLAKDLKLNYQSGNYHVKFEDGKDSYVYELKYEDTKITHEKFMVNGKIKLKRSSGGKGKIWAEKLNDNIAFQTPENELATVARRDSLQHPFFEPLHQWAKSLYKYDFGSDLGKNSLILNAKNEQQEINLFEPNQVVAILQKGTQDFGQKFINSIKTDTGKIDYHIKKIGTQPPISVTFKGAELIGLFVKEKELKALTDQIDMSQGMFRVLSIIIQLNYLILSKKTGTILIDDIGEGLDFERSCAFVELLINKARQFQIQLIMATNDRFIMNKVPLEMWSVIQRKGSDIKFFNYKNSRKQFDNFKFTGLNNFDFFATDFLNSK
jgi:AAA15 family ATPase/GTPase